MIARLSRLDLVFGRRRLGGWQKLWHRVRRIPRGLLLGLDAAPARLHVLGGAREAVAGITLGAGMRRYLPWLVATRGYRVGDAYVEENSTRSLLNDSRSNPLDLLTAWWTCRRWRSEMAHELQPAAGAGPALFTAPGQTGVTAPSAGSTFAAAVASPSRSSSINSYLAKRA